MRYATDLFSTDTLDLQLPYSPIEPGTVSMSMLGRMGISDSPYPKEEDEDQKGCLVCGDGEVVGEINYATGLVILEAYAQYKFDRGER
jgi:hypothetical protein